MIFLPACRKIAAKNALVSFWTCYKSERLLFKNLTYFRQNKAEFLDAATRRERIFLLTDFSPV
jgi:hypothetical protein